MPHIKQYLKMLEEAGIPYSICDTMVSRSIIVERPGSGFHTDLTFDFEGKLIQVGACNA
jgi:hypothetical protein